MFFARLHLSHSDSIDQVTQRIAAAIREYRIIYVRTATPLSRNQAYWDEVACKLGTRIPVDENPTTGKQTGGLWTDISYDPDLLSTFRHSKTAQPLHTDGAYVSDPPEIVLIYCAHQARAGGATIFYDGCALGKLLEKENLLLLERLRTTMLHFNKGGMQGVRGLAIQNDVRGPLLAWNYYRLSPSETSSSLQLAEDFHHFLTQRVVNRSLPVRIQLNEGDAVFFHDARVLHGRESFEATARGERCLWKCALNLNL